MEHKVAQDWSGLARQTQADIDALPAILPNVTDGEVEKWTKIIEFFRSQHIVEDARAGQWIAKPAAKPRPKEAGPQAGTSIDIRHLPLKIQQQSFVAGDFRVEKKPIVQGLVSSRRKGVRSDSPNSGSLKRKHEVLDEGPETISKRQEAVDSRLEAEAQQSEHAAIHAAWAGLTALSALDPEKGKKALKRLEKDVANGLKARASDP